jgi:DNA-binding response OmpR family regulator
VALKVLLVESESMGPSSIEPDLLERGDVIIVARNPHKAPSLAVGEWPDLIVLNACAGSLDVEEVCQALDETQLELPRLVVSGDVAHDHLSHGVHLPVPHSSRQLSQRIKKAIGNQRDRFLRVGDITLDRLRRQVQRGSRTAHLTPKEFKLLSLMMQHANQVMNRGTIMKEVWETDYLGDTRTLDVHIRWVREKLEDNPSRPRYIITVRGVGYRFSSE